jgi:hypothetical protein
MPILKSKKELVALVVSALVFAIVIYMMYFGKDKAIPPVAELAETAAAPVVTAPVPVATAQTSVAPAPLSLQAILASLDSEPDAGRTDKPAKLARSPFEMSLALQQIIYDIKIKSPTEPKETSSTPVVLTNHNARTVLGKIPGAEQAAAVGMTLDAVMTTSTWKGASINGEIIPLGDTVLGFTLTEVLEDRATLRLGKYYISLLVRPPSAPRRPGGKNPTRTWRLPK